MRARRGDRPASDDRRDPALPTPTERVNAMTVDVEDYFQVQAFEDNIERASWEYIPRRVEANVERLLDLFAANQIKATFFTLGWIAERHPEVLRRVARGGHEVASHGYDHTRVDRLTPTKFREDVSRTKAVLEDITGNFVLGYRAPTFSIGQNTPWAYNILEDVGYRYSSSIYPIRHDLYGASNAPREPFRPSSRTLWEFPLSTRPIFGNNVPCSGGGYFRLLPYWLSRRNLAYINRVEKMPTIFYTHPWEIDAGQPKIAGIRVRSRVRHYTNLKIMPTRLEQLVRDFHWGRIVDAFAEWLNPAAQDERDRLRAALPTSSAERGREASCP